MGLSPVRRDRKFLLSLELHREIALEIERDAEHVRAAGIAGAERVLPNIRSADGRALVERWKRALEDEDWQTVLRHLTSEDEESVEMRNVTVFLGVLTQARRQEIVDAVLAREAGA